MYMYDRNIDGLNSDYIMQRIRSIIQTILNLTPDVVFLQEMTSSLMVSVLYNVVITSYSIL